MAEPTTNLMDNLKLQNIKLNVPDISKLPLATEIKQIDKTAERVLDQLPNAMLKISLGVIIIMLGWLFSGWLASRLNRMLSRFHMEETLAAFLASTTRFILFFSIFIGALSIIGVSSTTMAAIFGAMGIAIGFALRGTLGSIAGGLMMMIHRPMKVGDWVEYTGPTQLSSVGGTVKRIGLFSTEVNTPEHIRVFVPNGVLWENILRNHTYNRMRMIQLEFAVEYDTDVRAALDIVKKSLVANPLVLRNPEPMLGIERFAEVGVVCLAEIWVRTEDRKTLRNTVLLDIMEVLKKEGIGIAHKESELEKASIMGLRDARLPANTEAAAVTAPPATDGQQRKN